MSDDAQLDVEFDALLDTVAAQVDQDEVDDPALPDFLAVVQRAHDLDADVVGADAVDEVSTYAPIVSLQHAARLRAAKDDPALDALVDDVRGYVDHAVVTEGGTQNEPAPRRGWLVALAAVLIASIGLAALLASLEGGIAATEEPDALNAAMDAPDDVTQQQTAESTRPRAPLRVVPDPPPTLEPPPAVEPAPPVRTPRKRRAPPTSAPSRAERLERLDADANAAWKAGKLDEATRLFKQITTLDRRGSWAESAYGDLFTLARQQRRSAVPLWTAYLKRFPSGRFADDARAGLCRRAPQDEAAACWTEYLETMPQGSFRQQAKRALAATPEASAP
ncbi:MAG: hypothetical protein AAGA54_31110 [Myxococcota bacterium]